MAALVNWSQKVFMCSVCYEHEFHVPAKIRGEFSGDLQLRYGFGIKSHLQDKKNERSVALRYYTVGTQF